MSDSKPFLAVIAAASLAGSSGVFVKYMEMPATSMASIRTLVPVLILGAVMALKGITIFRGNYRPLLWASFLNMLRMYLFFVAFIYASIANVVLILFTWPIFVTILSAIFLKEIISRRTWILLGLAFLGILIVFSDQEINFSNKDFLGMAAALGTAAVYAMTVVIFKQASGSYSRTELIFYQNLIGALVFLPFLLTHRPWPTQLDIILSSSHALLLGMLGFGFFFYGLKRLPASQASLLAYFEIVVATCFSIFWFKDPLTWNMLLGGGIIMGTTLSLSRS